MDGVKYLQGLAKCCRRRSGLPHINLQTNIHADIACVAEPGPESTMLWDIASAPIPNYHPYLPLDPVHLRPFGKMPHVVNANVLQAAAAVQLPSCGTDLSSPAAYTALLPYILVHGMQIPADEVVLARACVAQLQKELELNLSEVPPWLKRRR